MSIERIIEEAFQAGVSLLLKNNNLVVKLKGNTLPEGLRESLKKNKDEIIQYLIKSGFADNSLPQKINQRSSALTLQDELPELRLVAGNSGASNPI